MPSRLSLLSERLAIHRLPPSGFVSVTRTAGELSVVCAEGWPVASATNSTGWRCLKLEGPFALTQSGVLAPLAQALVAAHAAGWDRQRTD